MSSIKCTEIVTVIVYLHKNSMTEYSGLDMGPCRTVKQQQSCTDNCP